MPRDPEELVVKAFAALDTDGEEQALALADEALALDPDLAAGHQIRGLALATLRRGDEAAASFARAVELEPDDPDLLFDAADYFVAGGDPELIDEGIELAQRGRAIAEEEDDAELAAELSLVEAMGLNALGVNGDALAAAERAAHELGERPDVLSEQGYALFELGRFREARAVLERAARLGPDDAWAQYLFALSLERAGELAAAERHFSAARRLSPGDFPDPPRLSGEEFDAAIKEAVAQLPDDIRRHVSETLVSVKDLPDDADLREHPDDPPLSPQMLGLFRGPSLRERAGGELPPAIFLYQRNLERAARSREELVEQIRVTVLHEVGHLLGLSDEDLHERGLE